MTVEERAQQMIEERSNLKPWEGKEELKTRFAQHLRDQIEECAQIVDIVANAATGREARKLQALARTVRRAGGPQEGDEIHARSEEGEKA